MDFKSSLTASSWSSLSSSSLSSSLSSLSSLSSSLSSLSSSSSLCESTLALPQFQARSTPAKSVVSVVPISEETRAIIQRRTGKQCLTSVELPAELDLSDCEDLVDVGALGGVKNSVWPAVVKSAM